MVGRSGGRAVELSLYGLHTYLFIIYFTYKFSSIQKWSGQCGRAVCHLLCYYFSVFYTFPLLIYVLPDFLSFPTLIFFSFTIWFTIIFFCQFTRNPFWDLVDFLWSGGRVYVSDFSYLFLEGYKLPQ